MNGRFVFRIVAAIVLLAAIAGIAWFAYSAGTAQGAAQNIQLPAGGTTTGPYQHYGMPLWFPFPFFGFGCFGLIVPLILVCIALSAIRGVFWGPRWGHMHHGRWHRNGDEDVPPMFREWHQRAHEEPKEKTVKKD